MGGMTHINEKGEAVMVDVHAKEESYRVAKAGGEIRMNAEAFAAISEGRAKKGDVLAVSRVAGIMAAKKNSELIPLCHNLNLTDCGIEFELDGEERRVRVTCHVSCTGRTGVEMEALTGASVALLTVYDMCKALDRGMTITNIRLLEKSGGKSGDYHV